MILQKIAASKMIDLQALDQNRKPLSLAEYAAELRTQLTTIIPGSPGTFWIRYETGAVVRIPTFNLAPPSRTEVRQALWRGPAALVSYVIEPDNHHSANALLYLCTDQAYALDKLGREMRRNVRRGSRELRIEWLTPDQLLTHGAQAYCESRRRAGLSDGTPKEFRRRFALMAKCRAHVFLGAWKDNELAGFLSITEVDEWAEIGGLFSMDTALQLKPNDTLDFAALYYYLVVRRCEVVSYGLTSIQPEGNKTGLHTYKRKLGLKAQPVHRVFILHPLLRPIANRLTLWSLNKALRLRPGARQLKKASGVLACILGQSSAEL